MDFSAPTYGTMNINEIPTLLKNTNKQTNKTLFSVRITERIAFSSQWISVKHSDTVKERKQNKKPNKKLNKQKSARDTERIAFLLPAYGIVPPKCLQCSTMHWKSGHIYWGVVA